MKPYRIYLSVPHMGGREEEYVRDAFRTNWLSTVGPNLHGFEQEMADRLGHGTGGLAVASGTAALHLVLRALDVGPGDRVAVSTLTFAGSVFPIQYLGAEPVFLDSEENSWNLSADLVEEYFRSAASRGRLPKVLVAVHLYGQHADIDRIGAACDAFGVALVEDAAESLGGTYRGRQTATRAPHSILSFNGNKMITTTGGGMVIAKDADSLARMRKWANQSREPALEYLHAETGYNYRMSNVLAGIGRGQLHVLDDRVAARRGVAARYAAVVEEFDGVTMQAEANWGMHSRWLSVLHFDPSRCPARPLDILRALDARGIESRPVWRPMHTQPLYAGAERVGGDVAVRLFENGLCLPSSSRLSTAEQDEVIETLRGCLSSVGAAQS
ncbi:MAG: DegT/DnrJ/EryC1/StrS family aminotransferase [Gemmatimonadaceae bacterium]